MAKSATKFGMFRPHPRVQLDTGPESRTRQEFADDADINSIMRRFQKTGMFPAAANPPRYLDVSDVPDLQSAMNVLIEAEASFMSLPARVRKEFDNDPQAFVAFAQDPENLEQMRKWGLAAPEEAPVPPTRVEIVNPPEPPGAAS